MRRQRPSIPELKRWRRMIADGQVDLETAALAIGCSLQSLRSWLLAPEVQGSGAAIVRHSDLTTTSEFQ